MQRFNCAGLRLGKRSRCRKRSQVGGQRHTAPAGPSTRRRAILMSA
jgi:hypothetical protein